ncbi:MAG: peptidoglycan-binding protein [Actinobacteria bacterium]|nr:peptidoglycan-binding protein [Actinomycetota bacterium]
MSGFPRIVALVLLAAAFVAVGWWAGMVAVEPPNDPLADREAVTYTVAEGSVGRSLRFAAVAEWRFQDLARNAAVGVVTSVDVTPGDIVTEGQVLYTVDLRPVVAAQGALPAFRDLSLRAEGDDVAQLQSFLARLGFYDGDRDGGFGADLQAAVRSWQESLGVEDDGVVRRGDLVFVAELPARMVLSEGVTVGAPLSGGELVVRLVLEEVRFWIPLSVEQRSLVPLAAEVEVTHGESVWEARIAEAIADETRGEVSLILEGMDGGSVCGEECQEVSLRGQTGFPAEIVVVPETSGPVVPVAAVMSLPDGSTVITLEGGTQVPVRVMASSDGLAVVEGIEAGDVVLLPMVGEGS